MYYATSAIYISPDPKTLPIPDFVKKEIKNVKKIRKPRKK